MAAVQIWFHTGLTDAGLPKEPPVGYASETVTGTNVAVDVPAVAGVAVIETDAATAYRVNNPAVLANDPQIPSTSNARYVVDVSGGTTLNLIST